MNLNFQKLATPTHEIAQAFTRWENDSALIPFSRPNQTQADLERRSQVTVAELEERLLHNHIYLIYLNDELVGEMGYQIDPAHLYKKETNTAWIGITIGQAHARGKGIGLNAMQHLQKQISGAGLKRIELGVFEFNHNAIKLYQKLGYQEISRIPNFTFWEGKLWQDIRMEKYI